MSILMRHQYWRKDWRNDKTDGKTREKT